MTYDLPAISIAAMFLILCLWMVFSIFRGRTSIRTGDENTAAVRENSELLRELIAINRQLLEKQNQGNT